MTLRLSYPLAFLVFLAACGGGDDEGDLNPPASEVDVRSEVPRDGTISARSSLTAAAAVTALGTDSTGGIVTVAGAHTYQVGSEALALRNLYAGPGEPTSMGDVHALAPKSSGGAWIAAGSGLFILDTLYVLKSPLDVGPGALRSITETTGGALGGLWVAGDAGLFRLQGTKLEKYAVEALGVDAVDGIAVQGNGAAALVLAGGKLAVLELDGDTITADVPPLEAGTIHQVSAGTDTLFAASARGLLRFDGEATPKWTRFALGAEDVEVLAVVASGDKVFARTRDSLLELDGEVLARFSAETLDVSARALLAVDGLGDVWTAKDVELTRATLGEISDRVSFEADVKPWVAMNCSRCHQNQTQDFEDYAVFKERAEAALARVRSGDMPRCDGGLPCAEARLEPSAYQVLESWIRDGKVE